MQRTLNPYHAVMASGQRAAEWSHPRGGSAQVLQGRDGAEGEGRAMMSTVRVEGRRSLGGSLGTDQWGPSLGQEARGAGNPRGRSGVERREGVASG